MFVMTPFAARTLCFICLSILSTYTCNGFAPRGTSAMRGSAIRHNLSIFRKTAPAGHLSTVASKKSGTRINLKEEPTEEEKAADEAEDNLLIERLNAEILAESGVELDQLINPSKVVNLERDLLSLRKQLAIATNTEEIATIQKSMDKKSATLVIEKRGVMRGWLKNLFVGQSVLAGVGSLALVYQWVPTELPIQVLGFWMWWLFIIPSLRARKPRAQEKEALDIAFLLSPVVSLIMPTLTKDTAIIWWANFVAVGACYAYAFLKPKVEGEEKSAVPEFISKGIKALDYGSGKERGERK